MSTAALTRAKPESTPSMLGRPKKYRHNEFRNRRPLKRLGFPGTIEEAIEGQTPFVLGWARFYYYAKHTGYLTMDDLIYFGKIGAAKAYVRFRPEEGCQFTTFANYWIRAEIRRNIEIENRSMISISAGATLKRYKKGLNTYLKDEDPKSLNKYSKDVYERLKSGKLTVEEAREWIENRRLEIRNASDMKYLDEAVDSEDPKSMLKGDFIVSDCQVEDPSYHDMLMERIYQKAYSMIYSGTVFKTEKSMIKARIILEHKCFREDCEDGITFQELGELFDVSKQRMEQVHKKLMEALIPKLREDPVIREAASNYFTIE